MNDEAAAKPDNRTLMLNALRKIDALQAKLERYESQYREPVAIVGMGCRFPGAATGPESFRHLLASGTDAVAPMPEERWSLADYFAADPEQEGKMYVREGGFIAHPDRFDAEFFSISPREATAMDPQQRLWLEVCWEALEHANIVPAALFAKPVGVFVGASSFDFAAILAKSLPADQIDAYLGTAASLNILAGRLSYLLGLTGPSMAVDTACSSSLVAVHQACQSLRLGECELAIAGGVNLLLAPETYIAFSRAAMLSPSARCQAFAASADGFIRSEGCGVVVLKRLSAAQRDGDKIWAVIKGSAVNQDGASGGLTVPSGPSQQAVIETALTAAGVSPAAVGYIEAHGTGTPLGDPIEMRALAACYGSKRPTENALSVGSVKTNLGHLEAAAGIAGLIKTTLGLHYAEIYPHLHFQRPSSHIDWDSWPVNIPQKLSAWTGFAAQPRTAAVSSFGLSGTNAHMVLQQAPVAADAETEPAASIPLLLLSAKTKSALQHLATAYASRLSASDQAVNLTDVCWTAGRYRSRFKHRLAVYAESAAAVKSALEQFSEDGTAEHGIYREQAQERPKAAFLFTGQGAQWAGMGEHMYGYYPVFSHYVDVCDRWLQSNAGLALKPLLLASGDDARQRLSQTRYAQPALFAFEYAWAKQWQAWGVEPVCLLGHSLGEYTAAALAGVFSLEQALQLVVKRAELMQQAPGDGAMAAIFADIEQIRQRLTRYAGLSIAAFNSDVNHVVSGPAGELKTFLDECAAAGIEYALLQTSHGFHSACMEPILAEWADALSTVDLQAAAVPIVSNLSGNKETTGFARADYWLQHLRQPVRFRQGLEILSEEADLLIEIGPRPVLTALARSSGVQVIAACRGGNTPLELNHALAQAACAGVELDWAQLCAGRRTVLPTYPWQRQRYWPEWYAAKPVTLDDRNASAGQWLSSAAFEQGTEVFSYRLNTAAWPWLLQHQVYGYHIAPLAVFIAVIYQALGTRFGGGDFAVNAVEIERALVIRDNGPLELQLLLQRCEPNSTAAFTIQILSRADTATQWNRHVSGEIVLSPPVAARADRVGSSQDGERMDADRFYRLFEENGLRYGKAFQGIASVWRNSSGKATAELGTLPPAMELTLHPLILDMAMQMLAGVLEDTEGGLGLPARIESLQCFSTQLNSARWISAESADQRRVDVVLYDQRQQPLFAMSGIDVVTVSETRLRQQFETLPEHLYSPVWQAHSGVATTTGKAWLLISDAPVDVCVHQLSAQGQQVTVSGRSQLSEQDFSKFDEVVDLSALSQAEDGDDAMTACAQLLVLLQQNAAVLPKLTIVTCRATAGFEHAPSYHGAALWGMAAALFVEHAELKPRIIDSESLDQLAAALLDDSGEQRLYSSASGLMAQRLQRHRSETEQPLAIDPNAGYLISGGLGALGRMTAIWLAGQGATRIYLTTRQAEPALPAELDKLRQQYPALELIVCSVDVSRRDEVSELFAAIGRADKPLKGIVHAAGFADDDRLLLQSPQRLRRLDQAKLQSARLLDEYSEGSKLDFFVLYSSFNAWICGVGQGAYAAANAAMDALVWRRRQRGLPALSINWGPWTIGMQAEERSALQAWWQHSGLRLIDVDTGLALLQQALPTTATQLCAVSADWDKLLSAVSDESAPTLLLALIDRPMPAAQQNPPARDWLAELQGGDGEQLKQGLCELVGALLLRILRLPPERLDLELPLSALGLDSLAAVELRTALRKTVGVEMPVSRLLQSDGHGLVEFLEQRFAGEASERTVAPQTEEIIEGEL